MCNPLWCNECTNNPITKGNINNHTNLFIQQSPKKPTTNIAQGNWGKNGEKMTHRGHPSKKQGYRYADMRFFQKEGYNALGDMVNLKD